MKKNFKVNLGFEIGENVAILRFAVRVADAKKSFGDACNSSQFTQFELEECFAVDLSCPEGYEKYALSKVGRKEFREYAWHCVDDICKKYSLKWKEIKDTKEFDIEVRGSFGNSATIAMCQQQ